MASPGNTVLIAGKGHEDYQEFGNRERIHFDDREVAEEFLKEVCPA
jgi:UDP-N-acetylmuramoyl-L-alanyl-D-glutamate--2,6-diaminopimelate ligase